MGHITQKLDDQFCSGFIDTMRTKCFPGFKFKARWPQVFGRLEKTTRLASVFDAMLGVGQSLTGVAKGHKKMQVRDLHTLRIAPKALASKSKRNGGNGKQLEKTCTPGDPAWRTYFRIPASFASQHYTHQATNAP
ncbi:MAG: hypothetical protein ACKVU2_06750 [Saprospiraceae bacterium]